MNRVILGIQRLIVNQYQKAAFVAFFAKEWLNTAMLSYLRGTVLSKRDRYIILVVGEHTGYRIYVSTQLMEQLNPQGEVSFYIYTHVKDDAIELFGFPN